MKPSVSPASRSVLPSPSQSTAQAILPHGVADLELLGVGRAGRASLESRGCACADVLIEPAVVARPLGMRQLRALPESAGHEIQEPVAVEIRDLHAGVSIADQIPSTERDHGACVEDGPGPRADVLEEPDRARLGAGKQVEMAIAVNVGAIEPRIGEDDVLSGRLHGNCVGQSGQAIRARPQVAIEPAAVVAAHQQVGPAVAVPVADKRDRWEPSARLRSAGHRYSGDRAERPDPGKRKPPFLPRHVPVEHDLARVGAVHEARQEILLSVAVPVVEGHGHPTAIGAGILGEHEQLAVGTSVAPGPPAGCRPRSHSSTRRARLRP